MNFIVGSGPAGVSAALALVDQGQPVTMIDAGYQLEPDRQDVVNSLHSKKRDAWDPLELQALRQKTEAWIGGIPLKRIYGSTYPIRGVDQFVLEESEKFWTLASLGQGGLSAIWGAAVLPFEAADFKQWPLTLEDLVPHYRKILSVLPLSARKDALEMHYPLYVDNPPALALSLQAQAFYADLDKKRSQLEQQRLFFGAARLAVRVLNGSQGPGCVYCGLCLYGCPYELIYNSAQMLSRLRQNANFKYRSGLLVDRVLEKGSEVELVGRVLEGGESFRLVGSRVFLAGGVLNTARIMLASMEAREKELTVCSNQNFILPLLRFRSISQVSKENLHTLAQLFIEYFDPQSIRGNVHMQVYSYNDLYISALQKLFGPLFAAIKPFLNPLLGRLLIVQGYLHSDYSPTLKLRWDPVSKRVRVQSQRHPQTHERIKTITGLFLRNMRQFQALPLIPILKLSGPGIGAHIGGSFPMRKNPGPFETDRLGIPTGYRRVHLVDASGFPDIPANTITLTIMANAHRIASVASLEGA